MMTKLQAAIPRPGSGSMPFVVVVLMLVMIAGKAPVAQAEDVHLLDLARDDAPPELTLPIGKSRIIRSPRALDQVLIGNADVADVRMLTDNEALVLGKAAGTTNMVFRDRNRNVIAVRDLTVGHDVGKLKRKLWEVMPEEEHLEIRTSNNQIILSGEVTSALNMERVKSVARSYVPEDRIINMMEVAGGHQVALEVRIAEVARRSLRELGMSTTIADSGTRSVTTATTGGVLQSSPFLEVGVSTTNRLGLDAIDVQLQALERSGLARILAEPNLTAQSGEEASFLAGGEVPIPVAQAGVTPGAITVDFKEFGIGLRFTPMVLKRDKINVRMRAEVSSIDEASGTDISGVSVPGISTRRAGTTVEIGDGQAFAIAGLLQSDMNNIVNEVPGLGRIPVLGALFRSTRFQREETELVIIVTPRLVRPDRPENLALPTDVVLPPSWIDQYLLGSVERWPAPDREERRGRDDSAAARPVDGLEGFYGHQLGSRSSR